MNVKIKKNPFILCVIAVCITGCSKLGLYNQLPGDPYIQVEDARNKDNKIASVVIKNSEGKVIPNYYLSFTQNPSVSTPSDVIDTMFVCVPPNADIANLRMVLTMADNAMSAQVEDTNKIRIFEPLETPYSAILPSGKKISYTYVDRDGLYVTFSNGYKRQYVIFLKVLDHKPPRIYGLGSYSGGIDSVYYDDAHQELTIFRSALNTSMIQTLNYKIDPAEAEIGDPQFAPGSIFDFSTAVQQTIRIPFLIPNANGEMEEDAYTIKLHLGYNRLVELIDGKGTNKNYTGGTRDDREFKIAVDENYVYVLVQYLRDDVPKDATIAGIFSTNARYWYGASYEVYAYALKGNNGNIPTPIKMSTNNKKVFDIVCIDNVLYGIVSDTLNNYNQRVYSVCKWNTVAEGAIPADVSKNTTNFYAGSLTLFTAQKEGNDIVFYAPSGNPSGKVGFQIARISTSINGDGTQPAIGIFNPGQFWVNAGINNSAGYAAFYNIKDEGISIITCGNGYLFGTNFDNATPGFSQFVGNITDGGTRNAIGMNIEMIGNKYYMIQNLNINLPGSRNNYMGIFDFGITDIKTTLQSIITPANLLAKKVSQNLMPANFEYAGLGARGNCRTYKLPNGRVLIASLVPVYGFKVWELQ